MLQAVPDIARMDRHGGNSPLPYPPSSKRASAGAVREVHARPLQAQPQALSIRRPGDHDGIIAAKLQRRRAVSATPRARSQFGEPPAYRGVGRHPARAPPAVRHPASCPAHARHGRPSHRSPRPGTRRRYRRRPEPRNGPAGNPATSCATAVFSPEKLKSQPGRPSSGRGQGIPRRRITPRRQPAPAPARQAKPSPSNLPHLVEGLAHSVVDRAAQAPDSVLRRFPRPRIGNGRRTPAAANRETAPRPPTARAGAPSAHAPPGDSPPRMVFAAPSPGLWPMPVPTISPPINPGPAVAANAAKLGKPDPGRRHHAADQPRQMRQMRPRTRFPAHHAAKGRMVPAGSAPPPPKPRPPRSTRRPPSRRRTIRFPRTGPITGHTTKRRASPNAQHSPSWEKTFQPQAPGNRTRR